jgi:hypothetical protein
MAGEGRGGDGRQGLGDAFSAVERIFKTISKHLVRNCWEEGILTSHNFLQNS